MKIFNSQKFNHLKLGVFRSDHKMVTEKVEFNPFIIDGNRQTYLKRRVKSLSRTLERLDTQLKECERFAS